MRYHSILNGRERLVEVTQLGELFRVALFPDGTGEGEPRVLEVNAVPLHGSAVSLIAGRRSWDCDVEPGEEGRLGLHVNGTTVRLEMLDERKLRLRRATSRFSLDGPQRVDAPMPGKIVRVLVKAGDTVAEGQGLVVVEAMKMENELKSPKAGKVVELHAVEGAAVEDGTRLAVVA